tara:strand:- start:1765 stop:2613 length:849 start_codon:yes stop_codon:yes gene_type:complete
MLEATMANATKYCHVTRPHGGVPFDGPVLLNFVPYGGEYIGAGRVGNMSLSDQIHIYDLDSSFTVTDSRHATKGEDPRAFLFKDHPYAYIVDPHPDENGQHVFSYKVLDLVSGETKVLSIDHFPTTPIQALGKNWIPFEKDGEVYFIVTIEPYVTILHCNLETSFCTWITPLELVKNGVKITLSRGSTPMMFSKTHDLFFGIGHRTYDCNNHSAYLYTLSKDFKKSYVGPDIPIDTSYPVSDAVSLFEEKGKIWSCVAQYPCQLGDTTDATCSLYEVKLNEL